MGPASSSAPSWCGRSKTAGTCRRGWSGTCSTAGQTGGAGPAEDDGPGPGIGAHPREVRPDRCAGGGPGFLREPDLPVASHDEVSRELKLLVDRREDLGGTTDRDDQPVAVAGPRTRPGARAEGRGRWTWPSISRLLRRLAGRPRPGSSPSWPSTSSPTSSRLTASDQRAWPSGSPNVCRARRADVAGNARVRGADRGEDSSAKPPG